MANTLYSALFPWLGTIFEHNWGLPLFSSLVSVYLFVLEFAVKLWRFTMRHMVESIAAGKAWSDVQGRVRLSRFTCTWWKPPWNVCNWFPREKHLEILPTREKNPHHEENIHTVESLYGIQRLPAELKRGKTQKEFVLGLNVFKIWREWMSDIFNLGYPLLTDPQLGQRVGCWGINSSRIWLILRTSCLSAPL